MRGNIQIIRNGALDMENRTCPKCNTSDLEEKRVPIIPIKYTKCNLCQYIELYGLDGEDKGDRHRAFLWRRVVLPLLFISTGTWLLLSLVSWL